MSWTSQNQDGENGGIFGQGFDSLGSRQGAEFQVNTYTTGFQGSYAIGMADSGSFTVVWHSHDQDGSYLDVFGQRFHSPESPRGNEFRVNTYTSLFQSFPAISMDLSGSFTVVWHSDGQDGWYRGIFGQRLVSNGPALISPTLGDTVDCSDPGLSRPTITWDLGDYDRFKVMMGSSHGFEKGTLVTSGDQKIVTGSWSPSKKKWKSACNKAITQAADPNNPVMYIAVEGRDTDLPKSDPLRKLLSFPVRSVVQP